MDTKNTEKSDVALREEEILAFWRANNVFNTSVETPAGSAPIGEFVFYDGPPFATGTPHYGHILAGTMKDAIPRFWTMNGYRVERKWGWDCHGLPLENIIEKRLGLATKRDIEAMGVKQFNEAAREAVMEYADDWKKIVPRMGRFVDMETDYRTMDSSYTESVWWVFKQLHEKGLVYEGFKSMHLCPRCGTTLSNFEVNQGYKDIKDIAVTVKMPLLDSEGKETDTSILIWTTTPWTLPGNMAVAVHKDIEYVKVRMKQEEGKDAELVILAKERLLQLGTDDVEIVEEIKGSDLLGLSYKPPFDSFTKQDIKGKENAWKIYHADYVSTEDGTGAVHIAPAYGDDDMQVAKEHDVPIAHHVDVDGRFKDFVTNFAGQLVKPKDDEQAGVSHLDSDIEVVKRLRDAGTLLRKENITHSYPHCWRCDTPLLNYATTSWFVRVTDIKDKLVEVNAKVKWVPEHVGTNRFGKWLEGARDWAISRQRYWGAPLPIWKNVETGDYKVLGSLEEIKAHVPKSDNRYLVMRHGEAESNLEYTIHTRSESPDPLTEKGKEQVRASVAQLGKEHVDMIIVSPFARTRETAEIIREALGLAPESVIVDERIQEIQVGETLQGQSWQQYAESYGHFEDEYTTHAEGVTENRRDVQKRVGEFLFDIDKKYQGKTILIIGHNSTTFALGCVAEGIDVARAHAFKKGFWLDNAEVREVPFTPLPHNDNYELDFHRPYIDEVELVDTDGTKLERVPDVFDCWFESGSMPYAQHHFMGTPLPHFDPENGNGFPAQFIAEGLDQTRGWFYSLIVLGTALFGKSPYEQVIVNGLVLAEDGKKMSKSLQNYPDPMELVHRIGADAMRMYLMSSPVVRGEDLSFSEKEVLELQRKNIGRLHNVLAMYEMYKTSTTASSAALPSSLEDSSYNKYASPSHSSAPSIQDRGESFGGGDVAHANSTHVLDRWMIARLNQTITETTQGFKNYELDKATRPLEGLIDDISVWYLRRSRDRLKGEDVADKNACLATLRYVLKNLSLLMAPIMPFYAEYLFLRVREEQDAMSVHLGAWPVAGQADSELIANMVRTRDVVTLALQARTKANIKVRQPLARLKVASNEFLTDEFLEIIMDEVNIKSLDFANGVADDFVELDTVITPELKAEGDVRELIRAIQDTRKKMGLNPHDRIVLVVNETMNALIENFKKELVSTVGADEIKVGGVAQNQMTVDGVVYAFEVVKV